MARVVLLQFDTDPGCADHRALVASVYPEFAEAEPRWPVFFETLAQQRPEIVVISCGKLPSHGREAARYINEGFNTRNMEVLLIDVEPRERARTRAAAPDSEIVDRERLSDELRRLLADQRATTARG
ncbi:MAG TPA: hypothetical protein VKT51_05260 [Candidatus Eremiobacteraceae bacterium]|nr:hypothetical protein [Candidatus Eremiobacteraceae bacterium]